MIAPSAILFALLASACFAGSIFSGKLAGVAVFGDPLNPLQVSHARFLFACVPLYLIALWQRPKIVRVNVGLHLARTLLGYTGGIGLFAAAAWIPLSDATAMSFLNPIFTMLLAIPLLCEKVGPWRWGAAVLALIGAGILIRPFTSGFEPLAFLALMAAIFFGLEVILIKRLSAAEPLFQILLVNNSIGLILSSLVVVWIWTMPTPGQWLALMGVGSCMVAGQALFTLALSKADASLVSPVTYTVLIFATLYDFAVFQSWPTPLSWVGAGIIVAGAFILAWREGRVRA